MTSALALNPGLMISRQSLVRDTIRRNGDGSDLREESRTNPTDTIEDRAVLSEWLTRSRQGDSQAMGMIYEKFKTPLYNLALRYTYNPTAAEDLLQDIFIKVFTSLDTLKNKDTFVGWLYKVAVNTCLSYLRGRKRFLQRAVPFETLEGVLSASTANPSDHALSRPMEEAIQHLSTKLRSVLLLHDVQGFKHAEIAGILGCSVGTSKSQLFKARMKVRRYLQEKQLL